VSWQRVRIESGTLVTIYQRISARRRLAKTSLSTYLLSGMVRVVYIGLFERSRHFGVSFDIRILALAWHLAETMLDEHCMHRQYIELREQDIFSIDGFLPMGNS